MRQAGRTSGASGFKDLRGRLEKAKLRYRRAGAIAVRRRARFTTYCCSSWHSQNNSNWRRASARKTARPAGLTKEIVMVRFFQWILSCAFVFGVGGILARYTFEMAKAAAYAHQHDQMSYGKFTRELVSAKQKQKNKQE